MTDITDSPAAVALLQVAVTVPGFVLALIAGALADVVNRKRLVVTVLAGSVLVTVAFAVLSTTGSHTQVSVVLLTAALGSLTALAAPVWMAVIPGLVAKSELADAVSLSSAGMSGAMAAGPALGGVIIATLGPTWVFWVNAVVLTAGVLALGTWRPVSDSGGLPPEHLAAAMRLGLQYVRHDRPLQIVIVKIVPLALTSTALIALLPSLARFRLEAGPAMFGLLSGAGGVGAVAALFGMPTIRARATPDAIVTTSMLAQAAALILLATTTNIPVALAALAVAGATSLTAISTVMTTLQTVLPAWIRGRGVAVYLLALQGSFAVGAIVWGAVAERTSLQTAFAATAVAMAIGAVAVVPLRLRPLADIDTTPARLMDPPPVTSIHDDDGPIALTARWQIDPDQRATFLSAMEHVRQALKRQGVLNFHLAEDVERPGHITETFTVATWAEFKRLPLRSTRSDEANHRDLVDLVGPDLPPLIPQRVLRRQTSMPSPSQR
ncbi:MAG: MFS transporter [Actinomycetota bacterium]